MIRHDTLFKGATRPAMKWGVPLFPFMFSIAVPVLLGLYATVIFSPIWMLLGLLAVPLLLVCRAITAKDDQQFRLLGLKALFRLANGGTRRFWGGTQTYAPWTYKRR